MTPCLTQTASRGRPASLSRTFREGAPLVTPAPRGEPAASPAHRPLAAAWDWRKGLPVLHGTRVALRELRLSDAPSMLRLLATEEVARFISPPPTTVEQFERFIAWTHRRRSEGRHVCFAVVPDGHEAAVGFIQLRAIDADFSTADWGFAIGSPYWGTGLFGDGARLTLRFAFDDLRVWRLEARAMAANGRGNGALRKMGSVLEGRLPQSFLKDGRLHDQTTWSLLEPDWRRMNGVWRRPSVLDAAPLTVVHPQ
jgi:ribosomal-protein-alanine N-acetyltransferase